MVFFNMTDLQKQYQNGELSPVLVIDECADRYEQLNPSLNAGLSVLASSQSRAKQSADAYQNKTPRPLEGLPISIKDNLLMTEGKTTCGSKMMADFASPFGATAVDRLIAAGAIPLFKANMDEFDLGENTHFGQTKNPFALNHVADGSAAGVAAGLVAGAIGSDTGGELCRSASFCGLCALRPTYGTVSRYGLCALAGSMDQIGPIAHSVADLGLLLGAMMGPDQMDPTCQTHPDQNLNRKIGQSLKGLRLGVVAQLTGEGVEPDVANAFDQALAVLRQQGAEVVTVDLPLANLLFSTYLILSSAETSANLARFDGVKFGYRTPQYTTLEELYRNTRMEGFGETVKDRILFGTHLLCKGNYESYYLGAVATREAIKKALDELLAGVDLLVAPTTRGTAPLLGDNQWLNEHDLALLPATLAGLPVATTPCGLDSQGLPMGFSLTGKAFDEATVLQVAHVLGVHFGELHPAGKELETLC